MDVTIVPVTEPRRWSSALQAAGPSDFYHEAWYHALAEERGEGRAELVVATTRGATMVLPLLFRTIDAERTGGIGSLEDATSSYGYPGPVGPGGDVETKTVVELDAAIREYLRSRGIVSVFSRLHPLLPSFTHRADPTEVVVAGATTSIDLSPVEAAQWSNIRSGHRNGILRLRRMGYTCTTHGVDALDVFVGLYEDTMRRIDAAPYYYFPRSHYEAMLDRERGDMSLMIVADQDGTPCAVGLFSRRGDIAQYHLSGTSLEHRKHAPTVLLLDHARRWAAEHGARRLHLGGGVGGAKDSLFDFKSGFGDGRHDFCVWRWIARPDVYGDLDRVRRIRLPEPPPRWFPSYRAP
jgi:hypothetical protein